MLRELRLLSSTRFDSRSILGVVLVGDERLSDKLHREELVPLGSRLRTRLGLDAMEAIESRDIYELLTERHRRGSIVITSSRGPDEWLATLSPGRRRPIHQQRLRPHHRRRVLPCSSETDPLGGQRRGVGVWPVTAAEKHWRAQVTSWAQSGHRDRHCERLDPSA